MSTFVVNAYSSLFLLFILNSILGSLSTNTTLSVKYSFAISISFPFKMSKISSSPEFETAIYALSNALIEYLLPTSFVYFIISAYFKIYSKIKCLNFPLQNFL